MLYEAEDSDYVHIVPIDDLREHRINIRCWCKPTRDTEEPFLFIHHALDQREKYESGELGLH